MSARVMAAVLLVASTLAVTQQPVDAAPGDLSHAEGQFLTGSLLSSDLGLVASLAGEEASSDGTAPETNAGTLNLTALGVVNLTIPGGVQVPLGLTNAGVVGQYASALDDASSLGSSGLIQSNGLIGTGGNAAPGVAPGPLSLSLGGVVSGLGLSPTVTDEVAQLSVEAGVVSAQASLAAPGTAVGAYSIDDLKLNFQSATVAALVSTVNSRVAITQTQLDGLDAALDTALSAVLSGVAGVLTANVDVTPPDLAAAVAGLTSGTISDPAYPGITVNLDTGVVSVDLDALTALNGRAPNTDILTDATITAITTNLTGLLQSHLTSIEDTLLATIDATAVTGAASVAVIGSVDILTLNTTLGALRTGDATGISLIGIPLPGVPADAVIAAALAVPILAVTATVDGLATDLLAPVVANVVPALKPVLDQAVRTTVNNQSTSAGVFTETALRFTVLPVANALSLDLATARVGINSLAVPPVVDSLSPPSGPTAGGTVVTITGSNFTGATGVTFDGDAGTNFTVVSDTEITITSPPHAAGPTDVVVTGPGGVSNAGVFTFIPPGAAAPVVDSLSPPSGPTAGGTVVTITGSGFTGATGVTFDGDAGTSFTVASDTEITVTSPAHAAGPTDVVVTGPGGVSNAGVFTFIPPGAAAPAVAGLTPPSGPTAGGTVVTITGSNFTGATGVTFDGTAGTAFTIVSDTEITVASPAHAAGPTDVVVTGPGGVSNAGVFTFIPPGAAAPAVAGLTPPSGPTAGGTVVTITGSNFTGATGVTFDGDAGTNFTIVSDTEITITSPAHAAGPTDVVVTGPGGVSNAGVFTFIPPGAAAPAVAGLTPPSGPTAGGTVVTITGSNFTGATGVTFDGDAGTNFTVVSDTEITITSPPHAAGPTDVVVTGPGGVSNAGVFTFIPPGVAAPVVDSLSPPSGPTAGGTVVTITGSGFTGATGATFHGAAGTTFTVVSDTQITVTSPPHAAGPADVVVTGPGGQSNAGGFTFIPPAPAINGLTPPSGPTAGGTVVTITGSNFTGATGVTFDGVEGTAFTVVSDTEITVTSPAHAAGPTDVVVTGPGGASNAGVFTFIPPAPAITGLTPPSGPTAGGTVVTITGTGFTAATGVTFDGAAGTDFTVVSDTEITVSSPPHAAGPTDAVVTGPGGQSNAGDFTFVELAPAPVRVPMIVTVAPDSGPIAGGTVVTITGAGFTGASGVTFDGIAGTDFTAVSNTEITVTSPPHVAGLVSVVVTGQGGGSNVGEFTFIAPGDALDPAIEGAAESLGAAESGGTDGPDTDVAGISTELAYTGVSTNVSLVLAFALILVGGLFVFESRRLTVRAATVSLRRRH